MKDIMKSVTIGAVAIATHALGRIFIMASTGQYTTCASLALAVALSPTFAFAQGGLFVDSNGNVGIGTSSPAQALAVEGALLAGGLSAADTVLINGFAIEFNRPGTNSLALIRRVNSTEGRIRFQIDATPGGTRKDILTLAYDEAEFKVAVTEPSDVRHKVDILPLVGALEKVLSLRGISFVHTNDTKKRRQMGVTAQDVEKVFPELVRTDKDTGMKSVEYAKLIAPLIEAVKEQQELIESQTSKYGELRNRLERLEKSTLPVALQPTFRTMILHFPFC